MQTVDLPCAASQALAGLTLWSSLITAVLFVVVVCTFNGRGFNEHTTAQLMRKRARRLLRNSRAAGQGSFVSDFSRVA